jgi:hypothetical protein
MAVCFGEVKVGILVRVVYFLVLRQGVYEGGMGSDFL